MIRQLILHCLREMGLSPRHITERASGEFALALLSALGGDPGNEDPICRIFFTEDLSEEDLPRHAGSPSTR
jgi:hypothetical protein